MIIFFKHSLPALVVLLNMGEFNRFPCLYIPALLYLSIFLKHLLFVSFNRHTVYQKEPKEVLRMMECGTQIMGKVEKNGFVVMASHVRRGKPPA